MKKRIIALLLIVLLLVPAGLASAAGRYRVNTTNLQVRMQPSVSSKVLDTYRKDSVCTLNSTKDGWSYVTFYNGTQGYVQTKFLSKASSYTAWVGYDETQLRPKPDGSSGSIASLAKGTKVSVLSHGANYDYVKAGNFGTGYIVNSRLSKKKVKASGAESKATVITGANYDAWTLIASGKKVNLWQSASTNSAIVASYPTATKVFVNNRNGDWCQVTVYKDGNTGWMRSAYLNTSEPAPTVNPNGNQPNNNTYTAYVVSANKKSVHVRKGKGKGYSVAFNVPYSAPVKVLKHDTKWDYIQYNGKKGYVDNSFLQLAKPADADAIVTQDPDAPITPKPTFTKYWATVTVNNLNFHRKKGDWSSNVYGVGRLQAGDPVYVLKIEGGWAQVEYQNKYTGWVHKQFISP